MIMHFKRNAWIGLVLMIGLIVGTLYKVNQGQSYFLVVWLQQLPNGDKIGHTIIFGVLTFVLNLTLLGKSVKLGVSMNLALLLVGLFAVIEEFSQLFIVSRNFDVLDLACDGLGMWIFYRLSQRVLADGDPY